MPASDRLNAANTNGKALRPTLASTRTTKSTPLTPKLATASPSLTPQSARRSQARDDSATSTPRSSSRSRKTRSSSTLSTPTATPTAASRHDASSAGPTLSSSFSSSSTSSRRPRSVVSSVESSRSAPRLAPTSAAHSRPSSEVGARDKDARFFHASEVRSPGPTSAPMAKKATSAFYQASNAREGRKSSNASSGGAGMPSPPLSAVERSRPRSGSQFFHADTIPEARHNAALQSPPILSPSSDPYFPPHSAPPPSSGGKDSPLQPQSPSKDSIHLSYRKGASQVIRPNMHGRPPSSSMFSPVENSTLQRRRSSNESGSARFAHGKNPSLSSIDSVTTSGRQTTGTADHPGSPAGPSPLHVDITSPSTVHSPGSRVARANEDGEEKEPAGLQSPLSLPQSPAHDPPQNPLQKMNELAANARRERKVLDLEISNSSLLAINRQLEREVRKQKAELKRFRRLSRAGRLASGAGAGRSSLLSSVTEGETADFEDDNDDLEGGDEGGDEREDDGEGLHDDEHDDHEELSSDESSIDEGTLSPSALAERDAKYRLQDQKRLQLDLSKHRELLGDSQKLNHSLKRCIGWTEDLIKEGRKALDYQVRASDVRLGGRILTREEEEMDDSSEEEEGPHGGSLLSAWTPPDGAMRKSVESERLTDRDSGIELEGPAKSKQDVVMPAKAQQLGQSF
ncbi:uncharacterized protein K452DRAFT_41943 [Aplosporella prunicola CBS 121167]|uniref:Uncharacterized protein n=1 Tax=Aplosporella prunicola CBS 121167 TaxID=1176127 RepID=A0A6A6BB84_9PEZI|nr:uncharacterized protein K452DRAFT_41943 [Aplosporella prunicola CBS 121167]KAF2140858.1 hypothetical protein K452DRAFT_41943 [Aplosporella prunicola CBS 121167]